MKQYIWDTIGMVLKRLAQAAILRYRPAIVGVTGSVGKTSTVRAVAAALGGQLAVRAPHGNFNSEIGLPLTILGDWRPEDLQLFSRAYAPGENRLKKILFLLKVILQSIYRLFIREASYPEVLVLEYGIDKPGDMRRLVRIARPNVTIMTAIGDAPAHVEFFSGPEEVAREKARLIECLPASGTAVLNGDDPVIMDLKLRTRAEIMTFGFDPESRVTVENYEYIVESGIPLGVTFKLQNAGASVPVRMHGVLGRSHAYAAAAAGAVGLIFGLNLVNISEGLEQAYRPAPHRMQVLPGQNSTMLIDDSYNASPLSMRSALEALKELPAKRRVAVLGDMLEIGEYAMEEHEKMGHAAATAADALFLIGPRAKFIGEGAAKKGMNRKSMHAFETADEARTELKEFLKPGDLVLFKGSHAMNIVSLVNAIKDEPQTQVQDAAIV